MSGVLAYLGAPGVLLVLVVIGLVVRVGFWIAGGSWYLTLAQIRRFVLERRPPKPVTVAYLEHHAPWPKLTVGPRCLRWPLNSTGLVSAALLVGIRTVPLPFGLPLRVAWALASGIGLFAALTQATLLVLMVSLPCAVVGFVIDSTTVLRGGMPPTGLTSAVARFDRARSDQSQRLAQLRAEVARPDPAGIP